MKKQGFKVISYNNQNEVIDVSKIKIPENHYFYDTLKALEDKYVRNGREDSE